MSKRRTNKTKHEARFQPPASRPESMNGDGEMVKEVAGMTVTWDIIPDPAVDRLPRDTRKLMSDLHEAMFEDPEPIIPLLQSLSAVHPEVLCFRNWIVACHRLLGEDEKAAKEGETLFLEHPEYLFARLSVVEAMLTRGDLEKAEATLFEKGRTLRDIYPDRTVFHVT